MRRFTAFVLVVLASAIVGARDPASGQQLPSASAKSMATSSVRVIASRANVRLQPKATSPVIVAVTAGTVIEVEGREGDWYRVVFPPDAHGLRKVGYISATLVELSVPSPSQTAQPPAAPPPPAPLSTSAAVPKPSPTPEAGPESSASEQIERDPPLRRAANKVAGLWRRSPSAQKGTAKGQESESTDDETAEAGINDYASGSTVPTAGAGRPNAATPVSSRAYRIFVNAEGESGFADQELEESARDIRGSAKAPGFRPVPTEAEANVLLVVVKREVKAGEPSHARVADALLLGKTRQTTTEVYATLSVKRDGKWMPGTKLSSSQCCGSWRPAAEEVVKQAQKWLDQNFK